MNEKHAELKTLINKALKMMGYRQPDLAKNERWCKPFGFTMLSCDVSQDGFVLCQWMMAYPANPKLSLRCKVEKSFKDNSIETLDRCVETLCSFEEYSTKEHAAPILQPFAFLTKLEEIEL